MGGLDAAEVEHGRKEVDGGDQLVFDFSLREGFGVVDDHGDADSRFVSSSFASWEVGSMVGDVDDEGVFAGPELAHVVENHADSFIETVHTVKVVFDLLAKVRAVRADPWERGDGVFEEGGGIAVF